jgi:hypothetical protein
MDEITNTDFFGELSQCGDSVTFQRAPQAVVSDYVKNQKCEYDFLETSDVTVCINRAKKWAVKLDTVDMNRICNSRELLDAYADSAVDQFKRQAFREMLAFVTTQVDPDNQGLEAGIDSHSYNLGGIGAARVFDSSDIFRLFSDLQNTLAEACTVDITPGAGFDSDANPYILLPREANSVLLASPKVTEAACCGGSQGQSLTMTGRMHSRYFGFNVIFSSEIPYTIENGRRVYQIIAGRRDAIGWTKIIEEADEFQHPDFFGTVLRGLFVYGYGVIYPEALALARVSFNNV